MTWMTQIFTNIIFMVAILESIINLGYPDIFAWPVDPYDPEKVTQITRVI